MRKSNFTLKLPPALMEEARALAKADGITLNQFVNVSVAEMLATMRTLAFFERFSHHADVNEALASLRRSWFGEPPATRSK